MELLESVFNHLVLPPKLPGQPDTDTESIQYDILGRLIRACDTIAEVTGQEFADSWASLRHSLCICLEINRGRLEKASLLQKFIHLHPKDLLILHVVEQNAALLIRRHVSDGVDTVIFETFEASPTCTSVLAASNALQWDFPGRAAEIPFDEFAKESFQEGLATFLEQASMESLKRFWARSIKANTSVIEARDTTNPALITQMLMPLLEAVGSSIDVPRLRKRVRDDVNIQDAELPYRRLPFWLILRVATQRQLYLTLGYETGRACYKFLLCVMLAQLLESCIGQLTPELTMMLKSKLCRRLAKLELDKARPGAASTVYKELFDSMTPIVNESIQMATEQVESAWDNFKRRITRSIPELPLRADEQALRLSLPNSGKYLHDVVTSSYKQKTKLASLDLPLGDGTMEQFREFTDCYFSLARFEKKIEMEQARAPESVADCKARCHKLARSISDFFTMVKTAYDSNPEQLSIFILNAFTLWVQMDESAVKACPLLRDYSPAFAPELLDVLNLPTLSEMQRLRDIQIYLRDRSEGARFDSKTIFSKLNTECFAVRYVEQSPELQELQQKIEEASNEARRAKVAQWKTACESYDEHSKKISELSCVCTFSFNGTRNYRECTKCFHSRARNRLTINVHEDFLPSDSSQNAAVIFELGIPDYLESYRNATWRIFNRLGHPSKPNNTRRPVMKLTEYSQLRQYQKSTGNGISLASTSKSFLQTHFRALKMKVGLPNIVFPHGLKFSYYDIESGIWLQDLHKPLTFQHLCGVHIPRGLQPSVIPSSAHPAPETDGPSSYETIASQTKCASDMSIHEFMSYQKLLSGKTRRWLTMLLELGASNLNFSSQDTMKVFSQLAVQAGPAKTETGLLRDVHVPFQEELFCRRLTEQIDNHLRSIGSNWRETNYMEMLITLSLRLFALTSGPARQSAERLLKTAREATLQWISRLRDEFKNATEPVAAERAAAYGFWAALLCRRTYALFVESDSEISGEDLCSYVQASLALQENLVVDLERLPQNLKNMLARDMKMAYQIQSLVHESIRANPESLGTAIDRSWSDSANSTRRTYSPWGFISSSERWVVSNVTSTLSELCISRVVHYNFVEGHLLIDGEPLGRLPREIREADDVRELFGNQHLLTYPSPLSGMSHALACPVHGHEVHFGLREGGVIIRALTRDGPLEYIPRRIFMTNGTYDLPTGLVDDCVHWLNLRTEQLEIRRKPTIWKSSSSDWILHVIDRRAQRNKVVLVDPHSDVCSLIAGIFRHFEDPQRLTIFQSQKNSLSVELRHLELSFFVNNNRLLECRELAAEVDPNQDAGTLYGLQSKIVLRDVANPGRRSIITPLGETVFKRRGMHVSVKVQNTNEYGRFGIDDVLGRLSSPPEPRMLYYKALFHACTSFRLPDPLTSRTGTEEALHTLKSGHCQPWTPLGKSPMLILRAIQKLSPSREYYPKDKRRLQTVKWNECLTATIQCDAYDAITKGLLAKSDQLLAFASHNERQINLGTQVSSHLRSRGEIRSLLYERASSESDKQTAGKDIIYNPRDQLITLPQASNVYQIVKQVRTRPFSVHMTRDLTDILHSFKLIGGFDNSSENIPDQLESFTETNIGEEWGSLVNFCRGADIEDQFSLIFRLALLSFGAKPNMDIVRSLVAFTCLDDLKALQPPFYPEFVGFRSDASPTLDSLLELIAADYPAFEPTPEQKTSRQESDRERESHRILCDTDGRNLARLLLDQWPNPEPVIGDFKSKVIDTTLAMDKIVPEWFRLLRNVELSKYLAQVEEILKAHKGAEDTSAPRAWNSGFEVLGPSERGSIIPSLSGHLIAKHGSTPWHHVLPKLDLQELLLGEGPLVIGRSPDKQNGSSRVAALSKEITELGRILNLFSKSEDCLRQLYGDDLKRSLNALKKVPSSPELQQSQLTISVINATIKKARSAVNDQFCRIRDSLSVSDDRSQWLQLGNLWPCITMITVLEQLRSNSSYRLGDNVKESLVSFGVLVAALQRLLRMKHALLKEDRDRLEGEWLNTGHGNWSPFDFPDWLLLEIDVDMLIRREQVDVAHAIISPKSGSNSVLQMNMGKGKTSCVMPMAAAVLADKKQLSRLIVPKPLLFQTAQIMQSRLGGLVGREIRHIPFARGTPTTPDMLQLYSELHYQILRCGGVILTIPENILWYNLSGLQRVADSKLIEAQKMVKFQSWLTGTCRDVLDESDFTLATKTQLIYPSGPQIAVDGHPQRWEVAQALLSLTADHLPGLRRDFPTSIEVITRDQGFPMIHFLKSDAEDALQCRIIDDICAGRTSFFRLVDSTEPADRAEIKRALSDEPPDLDLVRRVSQFFTSKSSAYKSILLVRGLLLNRILLLCLKKRWNVQYGLHPSRHPVAVPFEAKGVPSEQAEFGHPDVAILFTCLAFYYSGLNLSQFSEDLQHVLKSDDPAAGYDRWTSGPNTLPEALHHWNIINVDDQGQVEELWSHLRLSRTVLDHYMNNFVFPVHAKQFGVKLQASGWDLPLFSKSLTDGKSAPFAKTTGFSGTNDNKMLLPLTIKQVDLPSLLRTSAEVLAYILQPRNRKVHIAALLRKRLTEEGLLRKIYGLGIRILIDAGAYILEMDNESLVKAWLEIDTEAKAAVYFRDDNRAWVEFRGGKGVPLLATPFAENLDGCLVYLDEAHTRGVDLKLPQSARGALTLALGQTKDHTVQAAMRLRQLGTTQSISFFAPPEVQQSILDVCTIGRKETIDSSHVVTWLLEQTCRGNAQLHSLYLSQGIDFCRRTNAQWENAKYLTDESQREECLKVIQHPERQTLEQLYGGTEVPQPNTLAKCSSAELRGFLQVLDSHSRANSSATKVIHSSALEEVEQEREVEFRVEEVRQIQQPTHYKALEFPHLLQGIADFTQTGSLTGGWGYEHAFTALSRTTIGQKYNVCSTMSKLFVSVEFTRTIDLEASVQNDNFLRPVEWILWNPSNETALIIIPEEAELLIPRLRWATEAKVHLIAYAAPVTRSMVHFHGVLYYSLPSLPSDYKMPFWLTIELGIFAGRLYIDHQEYAPLADYLQLGNTVTEIDGKPVRSFSRNPVSFLLDWLAVRRKGQDITHTPMGYICQGRELRKDHPFFAARDADSDEATTSPTGGSRTSEGVDSARDEDLDSEDE